MTLNIPPDDGRDEVSTVAEHAVGVPRAQQVNASHIKALALQQFWWQCAI